MSDDNGILMGVNKYNNSLVVVDIFNSRLYKNANMAILGAGRPGSQNIPPDLLIELLADPGNRQDAEQCVFLQKAAAGKTFTMQLMALRLRQYGIQVFILAPLKGHEFRRAAAPGPPGNRCRG